MFKKIISSFAEKRDIAIQSVAQLEEEREKHNEAKEFLDNLKTLSGYIYPHKNPSGFDGFREYRGMDEICFRTREGYFTQSELISATGLTTLRYVGGWEYDKWEASYREYVSLYESNGAKMARNIQKALSTIHTKIKNNTNEYSSFLMKYSETIANIIEIFNQYGVKFVLEDGEIFDKVKDLVGSFVQDYDNYTNTIRDFKKAQVLEKLEIEQKFVDKMIKDSSFLLDFQQK